MDSSKLSIKFYLDDSSAKVRLADVVPVFHSWIQLHLIPDHLLIDVADYSHVPDGPGAVLVAREANIYLDRFDGRLGLSYSRKAPLTMPFEERLPVVFRAALEACALLQARIGFRTDQVMLQINDRLLAPNTPEMFASLRPKIERFLTGLYPDATIQLDHQPDPKRLFEVKISVSPAPDIKSLLSRLTPSESARDHDPIAATPSRPSVRAATSLPRFDAGL